MENCPTSKELSAILAWIADAQEVFPMPESMKPLVDQLISFQKEIKEEEEKIFRDWGLS